MQLWYHFIYKTATVPPQQLDNHQICHYNTSLISHTGADRYTDMALNLLNPFDRAPDFVNEQGVKWWSDADTTRYAHSKTSKGQSLPAAQGWLVEDPSGTRTRLLVDNGKIIAESQSLEGIGTQIDLLKALQGHADAGARATSTTQRSKNMAKKPAQKTKKLTPNQVAGLTRLAQGAAGFYDLAQVGAPGPTIAWLVRHGLASPTAGGAWAVTELGTVALASGRVTVPD
jgi:hypothetical protein